MSCVNTLKVLLWPLDHYVLAILITSIVNGIEENFFVGKVLSVIFLLKAIFGHSFLISK